MKKNKSLLPIILALCVFAAATFFFPELFEEPEEVLPPNGNNGYEYEYESESQSKDSHPSEENSSAEVSESFVFDLSQIPEYSGEAYVEVNGNSPTFTEDEITLEAFESYAELDELGRCGTAFANICVEIMPTEKRESISSVKPSGWKSVTYDFVDGKSLYNRCHLIGFQLSGENANKSNLITGTRYLNVVGMLPFENMVADYVKETENHVLYRVTPIFVGDELVARGVRMEAYSVEDEGDGIYFSIYCYNVQPGVIIDYATGESSEDPEPNGVVMHYVLNTNSKKFHRQSCSGIADMKESAKQEYEGTRENLIAQGYTPCGKCNP